MKIDIFNDSVEKFIHSLEKNTIAKIIHTIELLETFGNKLGLPHSKMISRGIFEMWPLRDLPALNNNNVYVILKT